MTVKSTAAMIELRALIAAGEFTGTRIKRLVIRAASARENDARLHRLVDELHVHLEMAEAAKKDGIRLFSLPVVRKILDELETGNRARL